MATGGGKGHAVANLCSGSLLPLANAAQRPGHRRFLSRSQAPPGGLRSTPVLTSCLGRDAALLKASLAVQPGPRLRGQCETLSLQFAWQGDPGQ